MPRNTIAVFMQRRIFRRWIGGWNIRIHRCIIIYCARIHFTHVPDVKHQTDCIPAFPFFPSKSASPRFMLPGFFTVMLLPEFVPLVPQPVFLQ